MWEGVHYQDNVKRWSGSNSKVARPIYFEKSSNTITGLITIKGRYAENCKDI